MSKGLVPAPTILQMLNKYLLKKRINEEVSCLFVPLSPGLVVQRFHALPEGVEGLREGLIM